MTQAETALCKNNYAKHAVPQTAAAALLVEFHSTQGQERRSRFGSLQKAITLQRSVTTITYQNVPGFRIKPKKLKQYIRGVRPAAYNAAGAEGKGKNPPVVKETRTRQQ